LQQERFIPFWGVEFGAGVLYNEVTSTLNQSFNTNRVTSTSTKIFAGPSCRAGLMVAFTKHILVGTEFYLNAQISVSEVSNAGGGFTNGVAPFNLGFQAPTALFLLFRY
jgi:hypothetical protein